MIDTEKTVQVSTRVVPWMKLGGIVETLDAGEALRLGGLDFTVSARDLAYAPEGAHDGSTWTEAPHRKMIVRDDTGAPFDVVSADYAVWQYAEMLNFKGIQYQAAGTLKGGRQGFLVGSFPGNKELALLDGEDGHELYVVIRASHDRTRKIEVAMMPLRGRCMNQLPLATFTKGAKQRMSFGHVGDLAAKMGQVQKAFDNTLAYGRELADIAGRLNAITVEAEAATAVLERVLDDTPRRPEKVAEIFSLWRDDPTIGYPTSGWGLVNAVSSFYDWGRVGGTPESRFTAALDGFGQTYKAINRTAALVLSRR